MAAVACSDRGRDLEGAFIDGWSQRGEDPVQAWWGSKTKKKLLGLEDCAVQEPSQKLRAKIKDDLNEIIASLVGALKDDVKEWEYADTTEQALENSQWQMNVVATVRELCKILHEME